VASATLSYVDGVTKSASADASGNYSFTVSSNWTGTVTPSLVGYTFLPVSRSYSAVNSDQSAQNYTATPIVTIYGISGNAGAASVELSFTNGATQTVYSSADGSYFINLPSGWTGTITPKKSGYVFNPAVLTISTPLAASLTDQNFTATATATFADVPTTHWAWSFVEILYANHVTGGCGTSPLIYCPDGVVTRAQMAVFLLKGKHGSTYVPPAATGSMFTDVTTGTFAAAWIEQLANEGITAGCGGGNFCPDSPVTRASMAVFLLKSKHGSSYAPPAASGSMFADVPAGAFAAAWIEQLASENITAGCAGNNYCPGQQVNRAQMAVFLVKTFVLK
jgi:hypothetical protein